MFELVVVLPVAMVAYRSMETGWLSITTPRWRIPSTFWRSLRSTSVAQRWGYRWTPATKWGCTWTGMRSGQWWSSHPPSPQTPLSTASLTSMDRSDTTDIFLFDFHWLKDHTTTLLSMMNGHFSVSKGFGPCHGNELIKTYRDEYSGTDYATFSQ